MARFGEHFERLELAPSKRFVQLRFQRSLTVTFMLIVLPPRTRLISMRFPNLNGRVHR